MATTRPFGPFPGAAADPFRELRRLHDEMGRLAGALAPAAGHAAAAAAGGFPAVNVHAGRDGIAVVAELPGVEPGDLEVHAHQDTLTIRGARRPAAEDGRAYHRRERRGGAFTRTVQLPYRVDPDRVEARLEDGVLRLSLGRPEEDKPRRIEIKG
ncbi:MAG TPA: Hsp20/alpha crystallin family protein [Tepidisphaeraceae bacterium]|nr:Hsp20/alpha crystallin family protein [Tepidisphaeraceae bacterium]